MFAHYPKKGKYPHKIRACYSRSRCNGIFSVPNLSHLKHMQACRGTLGWRDLPLFAIFENAHIAADQVLIFNMSSIPKNRQISQRTRVRCTHGKIFIFLQIPSFYIKEHSPNRKFEIKKL